MLRALIVTGLLLMGVGFGAAAWQYLSGWSDDGQTVAATGTGSGTADAVPELWLASDTGAAVAKDEGLAYLVQDRLVPGRLLVVSLTAPLSALLQDGEPLPEPVFLEVMADIRAPVLADGLCAALTAGPAADCAMHAARVVPGSVNLTSGTARFQLEFAYRLKPEATDPPDPATRVYRGATLPWAPAEGSAPLDDVAAAVAALALAAADACAGDGVGDACRIVGLWLDWTSPSQISGTIRIGWLDELPRGVEPAPSLTPAPEN